MPKFKMTATKVAKFYTVIEAENASMAIMKVGQEDQNWIPDEDNIKTNLKDITLMGQPEEL
jgi:hypothetical protein